MAAAKWACRSERLRKALAELQRKGLLERRQGSGNYVRARRRGGRRLRVLPDRAVAGRRASDRSRAGRCDRLTKPADLPEFGSSDSAHRIRRMRFLNQIVRGAGRDLAGWPLGREAYVPDELSDSLYLYYKQRLGLWIASADDSVGLSTHVPTGRRDDFQLAPGTPAAMSSGQAGHRKASRRVFPHLVRHRHRALCRAHQIGYEMTRLVRLRHDRMWHDGAGAHPQHRACCRMRFVAAIFEPDPGMRAIAKTLAPQAIYAKSIADLLAIDAVDAPADRIAEFRCICDQIEEILARRAAAAFGRKAAFYGSV